MSNKELSTASSAMNRPQAQPLFGATHTARVQRIHHERLRVAVEERLTWWREPYLPTVPLSSQGICGLNQGESFLVSRLSIIDAFGSDSNSVRGYSVPDTRKSTSTSYSRAFYVLLELCGTQTSYRPVFYI